MHDYSAMTIKAVFGVDAEGFDWTSPECHVKILNLVRKWQDPTEWLSAYTIGTAQCNELLCVLEDEDTYREHTDAEYETRNKRIRGRMAFLEEKFHEINAILEHVRVVAGELVGLVPVATFIHVPPPNRVDMASYVQMAGRMRELEAGLVTRYSDMNSPLHSRAKSIPHRFRTVAMSLTEAARTLKYSVGKQGSDAGRKRVEREIEEGTLVAERTAPKAKKWWFDTRQMPSS